MDSEFRTRVGEASEPVCVVALELRTGRCIRLGGKCLLETKKPPIAMGPDDLVVAFVAVAELHTFLSLGWGMPQNVLDLFVEHKNSLNGSGRVDRYALLHALRFYKIPAMPDTEKEIMRRLILSPGHRSPAEMAKIMDYCETDVRSTASLLKAIETQILRSKVDLQRALLRGQYLKDIALIETRGIPIDTDLYGRFLEKRQDLQTQIIQDLDQSLGFYRDGHFHYSALETWVQEKKIRWPRTKTGQLSLERKVLKSLASIHPELQDFYELRTTLPLLQGKGLSVGRDRRSRCGQWPFGTVTGRNRPKGRDFIFSGPQWIRGFIKPEREMGLASIDYEAAEFGIAAGLSRDEQLMKVYAMHDPYLGLAQMMGLAPEGATKQSHPDVRDSMKVIALATQYGAEAGLIAAQLGVSKIVAESMLKQHKKLFQGLWKWLEGAQLHAQICGKIQTVYGWTLHKGPKVNLRTIQNFPVQANGAEMLRLSVRYAHTSGVRLIATVHDSLLLEAPLEALERDSLLCKEAMVKASRKVLGGFELRVDTQTIRYPDRMIGEKGQDMWDRVCRHIRTRRGVGVRSR